jgi:hypothetical protein
MVPTWQFFLVLVKAKDGRIVEGTLPCPPWVSGRPAAHSERLVPLYRPNERAAFRPIFLAWERECWPSSHATIVAPGLVRSAENADPADTSGFDRFAAQGTALSALIVFAG